MIFKSIQLIHAMRQTNSSFESGYFSGYYRPNVGDFDEKSLTQAVNWFSGWLSYLDKHVDFQESSKRKVLEIGCSIGAVSHILSDRGFEVHASDISQYAVIRAKKLAKKLKKDISFYVFDVHKKIPIKEKFNIIIAFEVIEHLRDPRRAISNMKNKLTADGILICSTPNKKTDMSSDPTHINVKSVNEWRRIFKKEGFKKVLIEQVSFLPFFYKFNKHFHLTLPIAVKSKYINSPLFIIAYNK